MKTFNFLFYDRSISVATPFSSEQKLQRLKIKRERETHTDRRTEKEGGRV